MQMAKRVSLSWPRGLNRDPHEIESLASWLPVCAGWSDAPVENDRTHASASSHPISSMCHQDSTSIVDLQRSKNSYARLMSDRTRRQGDRTRRTASGRARVTAMPWSDASLPPPEAEPSHVRSTLVNFPGSQKETKRVRSHTTWRAPASARPCLAFKLVSATVTRTGCGHCVSGSHSVPASGRRPSYAIHCRVDRTHPCRLQSKVRSTWNSSSTSPTSPPLLKCANHQVSHLMHVC
jgi:hypothetical protein